MTTENAVGAVTGVRVLDLAGEGAILGTKLLADLGADVLRVEPPGGDGIRRLGPWADPPRSHGPAPTVDVSLSHWWYNAGKRSAVIDADSDAGREQLAELAGQADIVVETGEWPLDVPAVQAAHPEVTVVSVRGFGLTGPRREWQSSDLIAWATGGAMSTTGLPDRAPIRANWAAADHITGLYAAIGGLAGLSQRRDTGRGVHFDLSRQEAVASLLISHLQMWLYAGTIQPRVGLGNPLTTVWGDFETLDSRVMMAAITQGQWSALIDWAIEEGDYEEWLRDPALVPSATRNAHRDRINPWITEWMKRRKTHDLVLEANRRRIPCAATNSPRDVLDDAQMRSRGFFIPVDMPALGRTIDQAVLPYHIPGEAPGRPAPDLGADDPAWGGPHPPAPSPTRRGGDGTAAAVGGPLAAGGDVSSGSSSPTRQGGEGPAAAAGPAATGGDVATDPPSPRRRGGEGVRSFPGPTGTGPLAGWKVLDLTWVLAGPIATRVLADLGADTLKVEPRGVGDPLRGFAPYCNGQPDPNQASLFHGCARNRLGLAIDLARPEAVAILKRLAAWADIVIENFGAGVLRRLGLGPEELFAVKPDLIQISLSGYGQEGPTARYPSFAAISEARAGLNYSIAYEDGAMAGPSIWLGDTGAGLQVAVAALAAREYHRRTGRGIHLDMSQQEAATLFLGPSLLDAAVHDRPFRPAGNQLPDRMAAPHGAFPARGDDRWIAIAVLTEAHWAALAHAMGRPDLTRDARFATAADRVANVAALDEIVGEWTRQHDPHDLAERLQAAGVPAGVVQTAPDLLDRDPHLAARGFYQRIDQPEVGQIPISSLPLRWSADPAPIRLPAPRVGEHNEAILREIAGLSEEEYVDLIVNDVI